MQSTFKFTDTGCYLNNSRGHYISRDVVEFAIAHGFIVGLSDQYVLDSYEERSHEDNFPFEVIVELSDEAIQWLNQDDGDERLPGQNFAPARPDGYYFDWNDGDFGLYSQYEDVRVEEADDEHDVCPDCGNTGTKMGPGGYTFCVRYLSCWGDG